jgi:5-formyltetrahydrofolate cyclo-ligase
VPTIIDEKSQMRAEIRKWRRGLESAEIDHRSAVICEALITAVKSSTPSSVMVFDSVPGEPRLEIFREWLREHGIEIAVPEDDPNPRNIDVVVVPGVAFTADGHRLGQGGGWYDRFLSDVGGETVTIGVCFAEQVVSVVPQEPHDISVRRVISV